MVEGCAWRAARQSSAVTRPCRSRKVPLRTAAVAGRAWRARVLRRECAEDAAVAVVEDGASVRVVEVAVAEDAAAEAAWCRRVAMDREIRSAPLHSPHRAPGHHVRART